MHIDVYRVNYFFSFCRCISGGTGFGFELSGKVVRSAPSGLKGVNAPKGDAPGPGVKGLRGYDGGAGR